jgi:hypothetical protein
MVQEDSTYSASVGGFVSGCGLAQTKEEDLVKSWGDRLN